MILVPSGKIFSVMGKSTTLRHKRLNVRFIIKAWNDALLLKKM